MFRLIETAIAFCVTMLAASLFVSAAVQAMQRLGRYRGRTLEHLLSSVLHGFRFFNNDPDVLEAEDPKTPLPKRNQLASGIQQAELAFLSDVLSDPTVRGRARGSSPGVPLANLSDATDFISQDALIALIENHATWHASNVTARAGSSSPDDLPLPEEWVGRRCPNATVGAMRRYLEMWFPRLEATVSDGFKGRVRMLTFVTASLFVVLTNFDGLRVVQNLYDDSATRERATRYAESVKTLAEAQRAQGRLNTDSIPNPTTHSAAVDLSEGDAALAALRTVDQPGLGLGWQDSAISRSFCAYRGTCLQGLPAIGLGSLLNVVVIWMLGLAFSVSMLSLGAPFWYGILVNVLKLRSQVQGLAPLPAAPAVTAVAAVAATTSPPSASLPPTSARF